MMIMSFRNAVRYGAAILLTCLAGAATTSRAALDFEPFAYTGTTLNGQAGGTGWSGGWIASHGTPTPPSDQLSDDGVSLSYPVSFESPLVTPPTSGSRVSTGGLAAIAGSTRLLSQPINLSQDGNVRYISGLFQKTAANGGGVTNDNVLIEFFDSVTPTPNRRFGVGIEGTGDKPWLNASGSATAATAVVPGTTYFLVAKIVSSAASQDAAFLKVFAATDYLTQVPIAEPNTWDATVLTSTNANLDRIRIRIDPGNTSTTPGQVDEIRIGDTWASVTNGVVAVPGDYNGNGVVDAADYAVWRKNSGGSGGSASVGDSEPDGDVDADDYNFWRARFGNGGPGSGASLSSSSVPEPGSLFLVAMTVVAMLVAAHRRARMVLKPAHGLPSR